MPTASIRPSSPIAAPNSASRASAAGVILVRVIVPLWVLAGALFKLYERDPKNLPSVILANARDHLRIENLDVLLRTLIGFELFAVGVMLFVPRLARAMATFMLACFCAILLGEMYRGAIKCGCFGSLPLKPWHMLVIDGTQLALVLAFAYRWGGGARRATVNTERAVGNQAATVALAAVIAVVSMAVAFIVPERSGIDRVVTNTGPNGAPNEPTTASTGGGTSPTATAPDRPTNPPTPVKTLPASWYTQDLDKWVGKPWREIDLFQLMDVPPRDMDKGKRYIIFYSRTCEHCEAMLSDDLNEPLDGLITLVEVPASRTVMTDPSGWAMPLTVEPILHPEMLALPLGPSWLIQTPLVVAIENGIVTCAQEGEHKKCLGLE